MERGHFKPLQAANINTVSICILNITYIREKALLATIPCAPQSHLCGDKGSFFAT